MRIVLHKLTAPRAADVREVARVVSTVGGGALVHHEDDLALADVAAGTMVKLKKAIVACGWQLTEQTGVRIPDTRRKVVRRVGAADTPVRTKAATRTADSAADSVAASRGPRRKSA